MKLVIKFTKDANETMHIFRADGWRVTDGVLFIWETAADGYTRINEKGFPLRHVVSWEWYDKDVQL